MTNSQRFFGIEPRDKSARTLFNALSLLKTETVHPAALNLHASFASSGPRGK
jgi:hypothetical protein